MAEKPKTTEQTLQRLDRIAANNPSDTVRFLAQVLRDLAVVTVGTIGKVKEQEVMLSALLAVVQAAEEGEEAVDAVIQEIGEQVEQTEDTTRPDGNTHTDSVAEGN